MNTTHQHTTHAGKKRAQQRSSARYTCPMHPDVSSTTSGNCPVCGMALERSELSPAATTTEWVCPMHPEIVRDAPGECPI
ncbi:MAG TPA: heavy metal-binding domain-containing protein, partial [Gammaproteobacteria bacterium]|nr:heavy metal-binding domain-containing protein [Gammaproteobacteria bacterium]